ncbi:uncharacterized protein LOC133788314 [Humulus lupulus]|uniref:uncharacterized protein LOC133788314 n=1 Tax=Humulus lupulus TaxID=3486 RepID=UPI002B40AAC8|nr:uncharacterized protein LOC133788314 [Humulus lupulus]XP_062081732.1 uncharacterized protein LOC133788314 [Humulus lupulus]
MGYDPGSAEGRISPHWSVFDGVKNFPISPEALMVDINSAICNLEFSRATVLLESRSPSSSSPSSSSPSKKKSCDASKVVEQYDARMADEAFTAGCAAFNAGKHDEALHHLNVSLSKCPPYQTSAVTKLQSLISITSKQLLKSTK